MSVSLVACTELIVTLVEFIEEKDQISVPKIKVLTVPRRNLLIEVTEFGILDTTSRTPHGHALFFFLDILVTPTAPLLCDVLKPFLKCVLGYYWDAFEHLDYEE